MRKREKAYKENKREKSNIVQELETKIIVWESFKTL